MFSCDRVRGSRRSTPAWARSRCQGRARSRSTFCGCRCPSVAQPQSPPVDSRAPAERAIRPIFSCCVAALTRKVAYRLKVSPTPHEGFESLLSPQRSATYRQSESLLEDADAGGIRTVLAKRRTTTHGRLHGGGSETGGRPTSHDARRAAVTLGSARRSAPKARHPSLSASSESAVPRARFLNLPRNAVHYLLRPTFQFPAPPWSLPPACSTTS
jgi:hypothetical protein